jgi:alpha-glucosidase
LGDHDFPRIASRVGPERVRLVHMLLLTLRGTPTWYYADELGMPNALIPASGETVRDPQAAEGPWLDRMPVRTPMQWAPGPHAGFSEVEPWLPIASDDPGLTVERQRTDPSSVLSHFRALVYLRKELPALSVGSYRSLPAPQDVFSFERQHPGGNVRVHLNFGEAMRDIERSPSAEVVLSTAAEAKIEDDRLTLRGYEGVIVAER